MNKLGSWIVCLCLGASVLWADRAVPQEGARLGNFFVPEFNEDGEKKSELVGESARVRASGIVEISGFSMRFYEVGTTNIRMKVSAPNCIYNQVGQVAKSTSSVMIEGKNMVVTGENFAWDGTREIFKILRNSKVILSKLSTMNKAESNKKMDAKGEKKDE